MTITISAGKPRIATPWFKPIPGGAEVPKDNPIEYAWRVRCGVRDCPADLGMVCGDNRSGWMYVADRGFVQSKGDRRLFQRSARSAKKAALGMPLVGRRPHGRRGDAHGNVGPHELGATLYGLDDGFADSVGCDKCAFPTYNLFSVQDVPLPAQL